MKRQIMFGKKEKNNFINLFAESAQRSVKVITKTRLYNFDTLNPTFI